MLDTIRAKRDDVRRLAGRYNGRSVCVFGSCARKEEPPESDIVAEGNRASLSSWADYTIFTFGETSLRFAAPYSLRRYVRVKKWHDGYLEVDADYGHGIEEDYIDLRPVLRNLLINPKSFLKPIKKVEVSYAQA